MPSCTDGDTDSVLVTAGSETDVSTIEADSVTDWIAFSVPHDETGALSDPDNELHTSTTITSGADTWGDTGASSETVCTG